MGVEEKVVTRAAAKGAVLEVSAVEPRVTGELKGRQSVKATKGTGAAEKLNNTFLRIKPNVPGFNAIIIRFQRISGRL